MHLEYADNGCGFNPQSVCSGMGLSNISSRINSINGTFALKSNPGQGMKAEAYVKLNEDRSERRDKK
jgi:signal transduction histidine kinase